MSSSRSRIAALAVVALAVVLVAAHFLRRPAPPGGQGGASRSAPVEGGGSSETTDADELSTAASSERRVGLPAPAPASSAGESSAPAAPDARVGSDRTPAAALRVVGRIVDPDGHTVAGAEVALEFETEELRATPQVRRARSEGGGRFSIELRGAPRRLTAHEWTVGFASVPVTGGAEARGDLDVGDVTLESLGTLRGRAVFRDGRAASGVLVVAAEVEIGDEGATQARQHRPRGERAGEGGLSIGRCVTDADGDFRMAGLAARSFAVYAVSRAGTGRLYAGREVDEWYPAGARDIVVVVDFPRLVVEVVDPAGAPIVDVSVTCDDVGTAADGQLLVHDRRFGPTDERGEIDFEVKPGRSYRISAGVEGLSAVVDRITAPQDGEELRRRLVLDASAPPSGRLRVHVRGGGAIFERSGGISLVDRESGASIRWLTPGDADAEGWWVVPSGTYDLEFEVDVHFQLDAYDALIAPVRGVVIPPGGDRELTVPARSGGRFRLRLVVPPGSFPREEGATLPSPALEPARSAAFQHEHGARVDVRRVVDDPQLQDHEMWWSSSFAHEPQDGYHRLRILPGETYRSRLLLEPGRYTLRVRCPGFQERVAPITLRPAEEVDVELALEPES